MNDLDASLGNFLARVEGYAPGQRTRFAPPLDELIRWSEDHGLVFDPPTGLQEVVKYRIPDGLVVWTATPRTGDGAKLTVFAG
jgi:hypothetical protein